MVEPFRSNSSIALGDKAGGGVGGPDVVYFYATPGTKPSPYTNTSVCMLWLTRAGNAMSTCMDQN